MRLRLLVGLLALIACFAVSAPAMANPTPCTPDGLLYDDPGDQAFDPSGLGNARLSHAAQANADITGVFFTLDRAADGTPSVNANISIANLDQTLPPIADAQGGLFYYVVYSFNGATRFVRASNARTPTGNSITYGYGAVDAQGVYHTDGSTTGQLFEGPDGVVQIKVPADFGGKPGDTLISAEGTADYMQGYDDFFGLNNHVDEAPDGASVVNPAGGIDYTAADCLTA